MEKQPSQDDKSRSELLEKVDEFAKQIEFEGDITTSRCSDIAGAYEKIGEIKKAAEYYLYHTPYQGKALELLSQFDKKEKMEIIQNAIQKIQKRIDNLKNLIDGRNQTREFERKKSPPHLYEDFFTGSELDERRDRDNQENNASIRYLQSHIDRINEISDEFTE